jgi:hypothetical protein
LTFAGGAILTAAEEKDDFWSKEVVVVVIVDVDADADDNGTRFKRKGDDIVLERVPIGRVARNNEAICDDDDDDDDTAAEYD